MDIVKIGLDRLVSLPFNGRCYTDDGDAAKVLSAGVKKFIGEYLEAHGDSEKNYFLGANIGQEYEDKRIVAKNPEQTFVGVESRHKSKGKAVKSDWQGLTVYVSAPFSSELILETAKSIVDEAKPQFHGPYGGAGYSKIRRQRILDVVLWFFRDHKRFPVGDLGLDSNWVWRESDDLGSGGGHWFTWNGAGKTAKPCFWVHFKPVSDDVLAQCQNEWEHLS